MSEIPTATRAQTAHIGQKMPNPVKERSLVPNAELSALPSGRTDMVYRDQGDRVLEATSLRMIKPVNEVTPAPEAAAQADMVICVGQRISSEDGHQSQHEVILRIAEYYTVLN
jgi:hypothetical protein